MSRPPHQAARDALVGAVLAAGDLWTAGLWHPSLWAWRMEHALRRGFGSRSGARFGAQLASRQVGEPAVAMVQGDTPWSVLARVARDTGLCAGQVFVDAGAGQGLAAAVLSALTGARGWAVEPMALLGERARAGFAAARLPVTWVRTLEEVPVAECTLAWGAWTCVDAPSRAALEARLLSMRQGAWLVTVTHPAIHAGFARQRETAHLFPWGRAEVHWHLRA
ncbi:MAG: hypothetical protein HY904_05065 [Deltaproteobacteria bacterium]|nr:hypothetical protein [Deltaproteobacteria bacterium]